MLAFRSFLKRDVLTAGVLALAVAGCGGDAKTDDENNIGATTGGSAGTNGGSGSNAGTNGTGSSNTNGGSSSGSGLDPTNGGAGTNGAGSNGDDGGVAGPGTGGPELSPDDTMFRATSLKMLAPDLITKPLGFEGPSIRAGIQTAINDSLVKDVEPENGDGFVDLSVIVRFLGDFSTTLQTGHVSMGGALCPFPYDATQVCGPAKTGPFDAPLAIQNGSDCALDGTNYVASGSCFKSNKGTVSVNVQLIGKVPLQDAQVVGSWANAGVDGISGGWVRGFMPEATAKSTKLPEKLPAAAVLLGIAPGTPMIDFLSDKEKVDNNGVNGWWFVMSFAASPVIYDQTVGPDA
jgi:hypothetical protein